MRQILVELQKDIALDAQMEEIRSACAEGNFGRLLLHVYSGITEEEPLKLLMEGLRKAIPEALLVGTLSAGEIKEGRLMPRGILVSGILFEDTDVQVHRFDRVKDHEAETGAEICALLSSIPEVKALELLLPGTELNTRIMLDGISKCPSHIQVFGGYAGGHGLECPDHFIMDETGVLHDSVLAITYAGKNFHIDVDKTAGWHTLGMPFKVTKAEENRLIELDGMPAVEVYEKYLQIGRDDHFAEETFEFPLMATLNGEELLRHTILVEEDGSLVLAGYVTEGMDIYLCYGNPSDIVEKVNARLEEVCRFQPQVTLLYSCSVRRSFWEDFVDMEMLPFESLCSTAGFHTWGEVRRDPVTGDLLEYNITLLSIAMREGERPEGEAPRAVVDDSVLKGQASLMKRLTKLVSATTEELQKAYENMSSLNEDLNRLNGQLQIMADHDALTGLYNRGKIERLINEALDDSARSGRDATLLMLDVDHFKQVNDTYGHDAGDSVLRELSKILNNATVGRPGAHAGRWGGEEFFLLLPDVGRDKAMDIAERLREEVASHSFPTIPGLTISIGVISTQGIEDRKGLFTRVDDALYEAKENGRNRVVQA